MRVFKSLCLLLLAGCAQPLLAEESRQHGAHEHGAGKLDVALDGAALHIGLDSPAVNIVGFEQAPKTPEESESLKSALARLKDGAALFKMPKAAGCRLVDADVQTPLAGHEESTAQPDEHEHVEHEHHHAHDEDHEHEQAHADITATWRFNCAHPEAVNRVKVKLFEAFPLTQRLQVQFITANRQGGVELNSSNPVLSF